MLQSEIANITQKSLNKIDGMDAGDVETKKKSATTDDQNLQDDNVVFSDENVTQNVGKISLKSEDKLFHAPNIGAAAEISDHEDKSPLAQLHADGAPYRLVTSDAAAKTQGGAVCQTPLEYWNLKEDTIKSEDVVAAIAPRISAVIQTYYMTCACQTQQKCVF